MSIRMFEAADPALARVLGLHDAGMRCLRDGEVTLLLADSLRAAMEITRAHAGSVHILDVETDRLDLAAHRGMAPDVVRLSAAGGDGQAVCRAAIDGGAQIVVDDISTSSCYADSTRTALLEADAAACQSTPLVTRTGRRIGVCSTFFRTRGRPTDRELELLDVIARHTADFIGQNREQDARRHGR